MRTGLLCGRDHTQLGVVATLAERRLAIALSRGGARKTYGHKDPNEDACAFAFSEAAWLVAVADGHGGCSAAVQVLERVLERHAPRWTSRVAIALAERWCDEAPEVVLDLHRAVLQAAPRAAKDASSATTLSLCLVRPEEGWLLSLAVGDSHVFRVDGAAAREVFERDAQTRVAFLGDPGLERGPLEGYLRAAAERDTGGGAVVLATDGLSEVNVGVKNPVAVVAECVAAAREAACEMRPLVTVRTVAEKALAAQRRNRAGDNIATAAVWLGA